MTGKIKIVLSDLHLGAGFAPVNPLEDFISDDQFAAFLADLAVESDERNMDVELLINGDMIEFLQVPAVDSFDPTQAYPAEAYHPTTESASLLKMLLVIQGHLTFFAALHNFLTPGPPRRSLTILKGNHDVNLYWSGVQDAIRAAIGATGERQDLLTFEERFVAREGIYVEHGNRYTEKINRFDHFEAPLDPDQPDSLEVPPGSEFVINFFNDVERDMWWVDAVKPITALIWYGFAIDFAFASRVLLNFLRVAPGLIIGSFAIEEGGGMAAHPDALRQQLEDESQVTAWREQYATDSVFRRQFNDHVSQLLRDADAPPEIARPAPSAEETAEPAQALEKARDITEMSDLALRQAAQKKIQETGAQVIVFGHTHRALWEQLDGGVHINSGTWTWWRDFAGTNLATWRELYAHPETFTQPHYLTYVRVDYDGTGHPHAQVLDYTGQLVIEQTTPGKETGFLERLLTCLTKLWAQIVRWIAGD
ncbi:MAG TPA: hypothetical protein ENN99_03830 [Chloroflexi bacterium]|nr:hypothetical protein [Chloroflexota bacterium]